MEVNAREKEIRAETLATQTKSEVNFPCDRYTENHKLPIDVTVCGLFCSRWCSQFCEFQSKFQNNKPHA